MENESIAKPRSWTDGEMNFTEIIRQEYQNCIFSCGWVEGAPRPVDTVYFQIEDIGGPITTQILMRPDELAAVAWVASGALWSVLIGQVKPH
jgi:hypothetical protein